MEFPHPGLGVEFPHPGVGVEFPHPGVGVEFPHPGIGVAFPHPGVGVEFPHPGVGKEKEEGEHKGKLTTLRLLGASLAPLQTPNSLTSLLHGVNDA